MNTRSLCVKFIWIGIVGIAFSLFCLAVSGSGDDAASFQMYLLCGSILVSASLLSLAVSERGRDK